MKKLNVSGVYFFMKISKVSVNSTMFLFWDETLNINYIDPKMVVKTETLENIIQKYIPLIFSFLSPPYIYVYIYVCSFRFGFFV